VFLLNALKEVSAFEIWRVLGELNLVLLRPARLNYLKLIDSILYGESTLQGLDLNHIISIVKYTREDLSLTFESGTNRSQLEYCANTLQQILALLLFIFDPSTSRDLAPTAADSIPLADELFSTSPRDTL
jgi:hypothetical protein